MKPPESANEIERIKWQMRNKSRHELQDMLAEGDKGPHRPEELTAARQLLDERKKFGSDVGTDLGEGLLVDTEQDEESTTAAASDAAGTWLVRWTRPSPLSLYESTGFTPRRIVSLSLYVLLVVGGPTGIAAVVLLLLLTSVAHGAWTIILDILVVGLWVAVVSTASWYLAMREGVDAARRQLGGLGYEKDHPLVRLGVYSRGLDPEARSTLIGNVGRAINTAIDEFAKGRGQKSPAVP